MDHHTEDTPKDKADMLLESVTGVAGDLDEFVDFSMIAQAEALKFGIEHFRRRKPHCSGTIVWQLNDCWPVLSWALVDYHGFGEAAYYAVRRAFAPVMASFKATDDGLELWGVNDTGAPVRDTAHVRVGTFAGDELGAEEVASRCRRTHRGSCTGPRWRALGTATQACVGRRSRRTGTSPRPSRTSTARRGSWSTRSTTARCACGRRRTPTSSVSRVRTRPRARGRLFGAGAGRGAHGRGERSR